MPQHPPVPAYYRTRVGDLTVIALHEGTASRPLPAGFIRNATDAETARACREAGMPAGQLVLTFTVFAIDRGGELVLIDAGFGDGGPPTAGRMGANTAAAGR